MNKHPFAHNTVIGRRRHTSIVQWFVRRDAGSLHALAIGSASTRGAVANAVAPVGVDEDTDNHFTSR
jgi:hypothetical protein